MKNPPLCPLQGGDVEAAVFLVYRQTSVSSVKSDDKKGFQQERNANTFTAPF